MNIALNQNEKILIRELKNDSRKAFNAIYAMYAKRLLAYCKQYTKSVEDAEEIVQDVFVRLWNNRGNIRQEETLQSLLFIMSKHSLINAYRSTVNSPVYEDYTNCLSELSTDDTHYRLEYHEFVSQLKAALKELPETQRKVIELSRFHDLSNKEIAEQLSLSEQTIKNQLSLGLKTLREKLQGMSLALWLLLFVN